MQWSVTPITPAEALEGAAFPPGVIAAFNELIRFTYKKDDYARVYYKELVRRIMALMPGYAEQDIRNNGWLDVKHIQRVFPAWKVTYIMGNRRNPLYFGDCVDPYDEAHFLFDPRAE